tara:strand:- start:651 stop:1841 length:1191 start_codon:yes stop_codon:yes gene_type:complete
MTIMNNKNRDIISDRVRSLSPSGIRKFFDLIASMDGVISLGVGEPDFHTPWKIREAAIYSLEKGYTNYTSNYGLLELREELTKYIYNRYQIDYLPSSEILITVGVSEGLDLAMRAILNPGDEVIIPEPTYVSYNPCVTLAGGIPVPVPTYIENQFQVIPEDIEKKITSKTKAILIGYPNNPTGAVMPRGELEKIAAIAEKYNLIVVSDEVYERLVYKSDPVSFASIKGMRDRTISLGGFSKSYAMTGWRIGYAYSSAEIIEAMMKVHQYTMLCAPIQGQMAALEALRSGDSFVEEMREEYDRRKNMMVTGLNDIGLYCIEPAGAFYTFPSIKTLNMPSAEFAEQLLIEEKVAVVPGSAFGSSGEGHIRCCYAVSQNEIEDAIARIGRFVKKVQEKW